ncbi:hypothetical protein V6N12_065659 [Hibiscus sabdariffa]|uniref:Uncharacterized protein n=1 Tax=Hibiscus sabdariffa TaxID=183260 RepID=A0ABR2G9V4_9ROSI
MGRSKVAMELTGHAYSEPTKGREPRAGSSDGGRGEPIRVHIACRLDVAPYGEQSAEGRSRMGKKGWTMMQMHAQGCAATAQRALRVDRGPRKGHTGFDKSSHRGLGEALQGSGIMLAQQARDEPVISAKGQGRTHPNQGVHEMEKKLQRRPKPSTASGDKQCTSNEFSDHRRSHSEDESLPQHSGEATNMGRLDATHPKETKHFGSRSRPCRRQEGKKAMPPINKSKNPTKTLQTMR